jgi:uncharacterized protein YkwD
MLRPMGNRNNASLALAILLAGCGGGGGGTDTTGTPPIVVVPGPTPTPTPTPTPAPTPTPTPTPVPPVLTGDFDRDLAALYDVLPDVDACREGKLKDGVVQAQLASLNGLRALHGLPAVSYATADEASDQQSALMQAANQALSHTPPTTWKCYTQAGYTASSTSNLALSYGPGLRIRSDEWFLAGWMSEIDNVTADSVGHRRWLLDPFLGSVAYGRVAGTTSGSFGRVDAVALKVFGQTGSKAPVGTLPAYVAYPQGDYPVKYWQDGALLSFGVIASQTGGSANRQVNYSGASVTVRERGASALTVSKVTFDNDGYGLPNNIQFAAAGIRHGVVYDVTVAGVTGPGTQPSYTYSFRIVD